VASYRKFRTQTAATCARLPPLIAKKRRLDASQLPRKLRASINRSTKGDSFSDSELNTTETLFPGTELRLIYDLVSSKNL
jgi:hypothetical protein